MFARAGIEALLAGIPTAIMLTLKEAAHAHVGSAVRGAFAKAEGAAGEAVERAAGKLRVSTPVVVGAVIIGVAIVHGAMQGKRSYERRTFAEAEEERRTDKGEGLQSGR